MRMQVLRLQTASVMAEYAMNKAVANAERFRKSGFRQTRQFRRVGSQIWRVHFGSLH
jgi:hypothetical protein